MRLQKWQVAWLWHRMDASFSSQRQPLWLIKELWQNGSQEEPHVSQRIQVISQQRQRTKEMTRCRRKIEIQAKINAGISS